MTSKKRSIQNEISVASPIEKESNRFLEQIENAIKSEAASLRRQQMRLMNTQTVALTLAHLDMPKGTSIYLDSYSISIQVPWSAANLRRARLALGKDWKYISQYSGSDGSMYRTYEYQGPMRSALAIAEDDYNVTVRLTLSMTSYNLEPGTCRKVEIGEEIKTTVIKKYKIVCTPA